MVVLGWGAASDEHHCAERVRRVSGFGIRVHGLEVEVWGLGSPWHPRRFPLPPPELPAMKGETMTNLAK